MKVSWAPINDPLLWCVPMAGTSKSMSNNRSLTWLELEQKWMDLERESLCLIEAFQTGHRLLKSAVQNSEMESRIEAEVVQEIYKHLTTGEKTIVSPNLFSREEMNAMRVEDIISQFVEKKTDFQQILHDMYDKHDKTRCAGRKFIRILPCVCFDVWRSEGVNQNFKQF